MKETITIIAHRGNGPTSALSGNGQKVPEGIAPENTLKAFREAVRQGADGIEFDVYVTGDGEAVVIHDDELNKNVEGADRVGTELGNVPDLTLAQVKTFNVGQGETIPTLRETLDYFVEANAEREHEGKPPLVINLELKGKNTGDKVAAVIEEYTGAGRLKKSDFVFCSFRHDELAEFKKRHPDFDISPSIRTATLFGDKNMIMPGWQIKDGAVYDPAGLEALRRYHRNTGCAALDPVLWDIYQPLTDLAKEEGMELHVSTSDVRTFERRHLVVLLAMERSGLKIYFKTDEPAMARQALNELRTVYNLAISEPVAAVMEMTTISGPAFPMGHVPPLKKPDDVLERPEKVLSRPIGTRPSRHASQGLSSTPR